MARRTVAENQAWYHPPEPKATGSNPVGRANLSESITEALIPHSVRNPQNLSESVNFRVAPRVAGRVAHTPFYGERPNYSACLVLCHAAMRHMPSCNTYAAV